MSGSRTIKSVEVALVRAILPNPIDFGSWKMTHREYAVVQVSSDDGMKGQSFGLTRDGAILEQIEKSIAKKYLGSYLVDREETYWQTKRSNLSSHSNGVGLRALSLVDLATWDLAAKSEDKSISEFLGGACKPMPATAIVGYPPSDTTLEDLEEQIRTLLFANWKRFKIPFSDSAETTAAKLALIRELAPDSWVGCDAAWRFRKAEHALEFLALVGDLKLNWLEDVFAPGEINELVKLKSLTNIAIAMGDEQGGSYYPQALISNTAADVIRIDLTCMGGITEMRDPINHLVSEGKQLSPHMFAHVHSQVLSALGHTDLPIEWGVPWTGVDPYADSLIAPVIDSDGRMLPLPQGPGFNELLNRQWISQQEIHDPHRILAQ